VKLQHYTFQFVELMPAVLEKGVLYVSMTYATASHLCFCGCGMKVVTPLSPTDWCLTFNGDTVSLDPSIGNWSYPCHSHYILWSNRVIWAGTMSDAQIRAVRASDAREKMRYHEQRRQTESSQAGQSPVVQVPASYEPAESGRRRRGWRRILDWL